MWSEPIHLPVGTGLNMVINRDSLAAAVPMARILVQDNATSLTDEGCPLVLRVTEQGLIGLLGNGPEAEAILADGYAHTAVYQSGVVRRIADDILHAPYCGSMLAHFLEGKVHELLGLLLESLPTPPLESIGDRIALSVCAKLRSNPQDPPTAAELARMNGVTPRKLGEYFHAYFGKTIPSWLSRWRMICARDLLLDGELSIKDVAVSVGYTRVISFTRTFTKHFGISPGRMRSGQPKSSASWAQMQGQFK